LGLIFRFSPNSIAIAAVESQHVNCPEGANCDYEDKKAAHGKSMIKVAYLFHAA
jgi:hypothetical protein